MTYCIFKDICTEANCNTSMGYSELDFNPEYFEYPEELKLKGDLKC